MRLFIASVTVFRRHMKFNMTCKCFRSPGVYGQNILVWLCWSVRSLLLEVCVGVRLCMFVCVGAPYVHNLCLCGFNLINKNMFRGKFCWVNKARRLYCWFYIYLEQLIKGQQITLLSFYRCILKGAGLGFIKACFLQTDSKSTFFRLLKRKSEEEEEGREF